MDNQKRNYIISGIAVAAIALSGFFFYNPSNTEVIAAGETDNSDIEVVVVAKPDADQGVEKTTKDESKTIPAVETTEAVNVEDANEE
tara:strand:- start:212 stop:472 length:261 start_codon:yes stop_codon:yes gene_type:complete